MKHFLFLSLLFVVVTNSFAQKFPFKKIYVEGGVGPASRNGFMADLGLRTVFHNNWTASISYYYIDANPKNLPGDYKQGSFLGFLPYTMPNTELKMVNLTAGRLGMLGKKTWATVEAGISIGSGDKLDFSTQQATSNPFQTSSNYSFSKKSQSLVGGLLRADLNWAFLRFMGVGVGLFSSFNSIQTEVGGEFKLMVGILNPRNKTVN